MFLLRVHRGPVLSLFLLLLLPLLLLRVWLLLVSPLLSLRGRIVVVVVPLIFVVLLLLLGVLRAISLLVLVRTVGLFNYEDASILF